MGGDDCLVVVDKGGLQAYTGITSLLSLRDFLRGGAGAGGPPPFFILSNRWR